MATETLPTPPNYVPFAHRVLGGALASGTAIASSTDYQEVIPIAFCRYLTIRAKTTTAGGTLKFDFVRPIATDPAKLSASGAINPAQVTKYTSPASPSNVTLTAGTENSMQFTLNGESFGLITVTGGGSGTLNYVDVCAL